LGDLVDALPAEEGDGDAGSVGKRGKALREQANVNVNVIQRKSMKSRPGAMKRREKVDRGERERFARNLGEMAGKGTRRTSGACRADEGEKGDQSRIVASQSTGDRWAALRGFIAQTMEVRPEMRESKG
jgi:Ribosome biogenesis protein SLX9